MNTVDVKFIITAAILKNPTETEVTDILACLTANPTWGNAEYYEYERTERKIIIIEKEIIKLQNKLRVLKSLTTTF